MMRSSNPSMMAVGQSLRDQRDRLVADWSAWLAKRMAAVHHIAWPTVERHLALLVDAFIELSGPLGRPAAEAWNAACEVYGQTAAARGLASGEVVEEFQRFRELLVIGLSDAVVSLPPRKAMAAVIRLNRSLDKGLAHAVVGYTDALVEILLNRRGVPIVASEPAEDEVLRRLEQLEEEVAELRRRSE
jgi:hypothetical protein